jgi:hypothetical protein
MRKLLPAVVLATLAVIAVTLVVVTSSDEAPSSLEGFEDIEQGAVHAVRNALDASVLGDQETDGSSLASQAVGRQPSPVDIPDAATVVESPQFQASEEQYAREQGNKLLLADVKPQLDVKGLESRQAELQAKLSSMLAEKVKATASKYGSVLKQEHALKSQDLHELVKGLTQDDLSTKVKPFRSQLAAADAKITRPYHKKVAESLEAELDQRIAAAQRKAKLMSSPTHHAALAAAAPAAGKKAAAGGKKAAAGGKKAAGKTGAKAATKVWSWESPAGEPSVGYEAFHGDRVPAAGGIDDLRTHLGDIRKEYHARLRSHLRHAKHRLQKFRHHFAENMSPLDWEVFGQHDRHWNDYLNQGRLQWDLSTEKKMVDDIRRDIEDKQDEQRNNELDLQTADRGSNKQFQLRANIHDLETGIQQDYKDLQVALKDETILEDRLSRVADHYKSGSHPDYHEYWN